MYKFITACNKATECYYIGRNVAQCFMSTSTQHLLTVSLWSFTNYLDSGTERGSGPYKQGKLENESLIQYKYNADTAVHLRTTRCGFKTEQPFRAATFYVVIMQFLSWPHNKRQHASKAVYYNGKTLTCNVKVWKPRPDEKLQGVVSLNTGMNNND